MDRTKKQTMKLTDTQCGIPRGIGLDERVGKNDQLVGHRDDGHLVRLAALDQTYARLLGGRLGGRPWWVSKKQPYPRIARSPAR